MAKGKTSKNPKKALSASVIVAIVVAVLALAGIIVACVFLLSGSSSNPSSTASETNSEPASEQEVSYAETSFEQKEEYPYVQIEMEDGGKIVLELYPDIAPITVNNFLSLARSGFYDGLIFHRVISGFMIQGGDPLGTGSGESKQKIKGEFSNNGVPNDLSHKRGVISMARLRDDMNSASCQFFIVHKDSPSLDGSYAAFGRVVSGMDVVDKIASVQTDRNDKPLVDQVIKQVTVLE